MKNAEIKFFIYQQTNITCRRPQHGNNLIVRSYSDAAKQKDSEKLVGKWLLGCSGMVFTAVVLGGAAYYSFTYLGVCKILKSALDPHSKKH